MNILNVGSVQVPFCAFERELHKYLTLGTGLPALLGFK